MHADHTGVISATERREGAMQQGAERIFRPRTATEARATGKAHKTRWTRLDQSVRLRRAHVNNRNVQHREPRGYPIGLLRPQPIPEEMVRVASIARS